STIGLLYIMFIAGLELDMNDFKKNQHKSFAFGFLTFIIPITMGYPVCRFLLGYDVNASFLTACMFATHTLVAYPIVSKLGISKNQAVAVSVGGTILTDTAVLLILAIIISNSEGNLNSEFMIRLGISLLIFIFIMFVLIPPFARWFFTRLESEHHSHYIFVLSIVFFAAFLSQVAGVEPIIGAFMAGLALNQLIPHSSALMNRIEFIGNSLFIPFFLVSVGMVVDLSVLMKGPMAWIVAATLTIVALLSKWLAALFTQKLFSYSGHQRQLIFGLSSAHAAATLAIILVGYEKGILDENILNGTIILILITCIVASFAAEKASKAILTTSKSETFDEEIEYELINEHIVIPVDQNDDFENILNLSVLMKNKKSAQPISILSVIPYNDQSEHNIIKEKRRINSKLSNATASETTVNIVSTIDHNTSSGIARTSREIMANLILMPWPNQTDFVDKIFGERIETTLTSTDKTLFVLSITEPSIYFNRIVLVIPNMAELENGFNQWANKILSLAKELNLKILVCANVASLSALRKMDTYLGYNIEMIHFKFDEWEDFLILSRQIKDKDILVVVSSRKGSASYTSALDHIPLKLEKHFTNSKILIYPQQFTNMKLYDNYLDINAVPISKGIKTFEKIKNTILKGRIWIS
ncbi:MAG: hypothetical protein RLZZ546_3265, partial [Bacteroidota bacterium]